MSFQKTKLVSLASILLLIPAGMIAHGGGDPYVQVNGRYLEEHPLAGVAPKTFAKDLAPENYVVDRPINFKIDPSRLNFEAEARWKWSSDDTGFQDGNDITHAYDRPGTYTVTLQLRDHHKSNQFEDNDTIQINIVPNDGYKASELKVTYSSKESKDGWDVTYSANVSADASSTIKKYQWILGDGGQAEGQTVRHTYKKGTEQAFPILIVEDSNGIKSYTAFQIDESGGNFRASSLPFFPDAIVEGEARQPAPGWVYASAALVGILAVAAVLFKKRSK